MIVSYEMMDDGTLALNADNYADIKRVLVEHGTSGTLFYPSEHPESEWTNEPDDLPKCKMCGYYTPYDRAIDDYEYGNYCPKCGCKMKEGYMNND